MGVQTGFLLSTGYRFKKNSYVSVYCGPKIDFTFSDKKTTENSERKLMIDYVDGYYERTTNGDTQDGLSRNYEQTRLVDIPICFGANFRYKWIGIYFNYDIGMIDRHTDKYYEYVGVEKNHTRKTNHLSICLQFFVF